MRQLAGILLITLTVAPGAWAGQAANPAAKPPVPTAKAPASRAAATPKAAAGAKLPAAVEAAFKQAYPRAIIKHVSKETDGGQTVYEVESIDGGLARDLNYRPDGTVVDIEEAIAPADVPAPVAAAIKARYPKATIRARERLTKGSAVTYEFQLSGTNVKEIQLTPDGRFVSPK